MKYFKRIILVSLVTILYLTRLPAQNHDHEHGHDHSELRNEIGIGGGALYSPDHETWGGGFHLHYFRALGLHGKWALGGGLELARIDGNHFTLGAGAKYQPIERLEIGLIPGITFFKHDDDESSDTHGHDDSGYRSRFSVHVEAVYDLLHFGKFHLGPAVDYSWSKDDAHFMLGVHAAYCF